jgi:hypothetical protein
MLTRRAFLKATPTMVAGMFVGLQWPFTRAAPIRRQWRLDHRLHLDDGLYLDGSPVDELKHDLYLPIVETGKSK